MKHNSPQKRIGSLVKFSRRTGILLPAWLVAAVASPQLAGCQDTNRTTGAIALVKLDSLPLTEAIRNLARQADINFILDPRLSPGVIGTDGKAFRDPFITVTWTNVTAEEALGRLLKVHGLTQATNAATPIVRITFTNQPAKSSPAVQVRSDTNNVIPLVTMDSVPLGEAIRQLAKQAQLAVAFDSRLTEPRNRKALSECEVSFRWINVTARQALAALLDNYNLVMIEDRGASSARIAIDAQAADGPAGNPGQERK